MNFLILNKYIIYFFLTKSRQISKNMSNNLFIKEIDVFVPVSPL